MIYKYDSFNPSAMKKILYSQEISLVQPNICNYKFDYKDFLQMNYSERRKELGVYFDFKFNKCSFKEKLNLIHNKLQDEVFLAKYNLIRVKFLNSLFFETGILSAYDVFQSDLLHENNICYAFDDNIITEHLSHYIIDKFLVKNNNTLTQIVPDASYQWIKDILTNNSSDEQQNEILFIGLFNANKNIKIPLNTIKHAIIDKNSSKELKNKLKLYVENKSYEILEI